MPVVDIVLFFIFFQHHIRIALEELPITLLGLKSWLEFLDSVDLQILFSARVKELLSLSNQFLVLLNAFLLLQEFR
jgi:hypothetical protein